MGNPYIIVEVRPRIPRKAVANLERWLLMRIFNKAKVVGKYFEFCALWDYDWTCYLSRDDELMRAIYQDVCPNRRLCTEAERKIVLRRELLVGSVNYVRIFQSLLQRNPVLPKHISIRKTDHDTSCFDYNETLTLITAHSIESISAEWAAGFKKIVQRKSWKANGSYISVGASP